MEPVSEGFWTWLSALHPAGHGNTLKAMWREMRRQSFRRWRIMKYPWHILEWQGAEGKETDYEVIYWFKHKCEGLINISQFIIKCIQLHRFYSKGFSWERKNKFSNLSTERGCLFLVPAKELQVLEEAYLQLKHNKHIHTGKNVCTG